MKTPTVRKNIHKSNHPQESGKHKMSSLVNRRFAAWVTEMSLVAVSGLVPFGIGVFANDSSMNRVPLNPLLGNVEKLVARPLALPVNYGTRNVAWVTNILWTVGAIAPLSLSCWQLYLLAKTGSSIPKRWFGIKVVSEQGTPPGLVPIVVRETVGRWSIPAATAYILWRYSLLFPNLAVFPIVLGALMLGESLGFPRWKGRRAWHDRIAGTYTIDAKKPFTPPRQRQVEVGEWNEGDEEAAIASVVMSPVAPAEPPQQSRLWLWMRQNPSTTLLAIALVSMGAILTTLVGTQIYIQTQENRRVVEQGNQKQFLELEQRLKSNSAVTLEERQRTIIALGTLKYPQATQYLVNLLTQETNPILVNTIQEALVNVGTGAINDLKRQNQLLGSTLDTSSNNPGNSPQAIQQLQANQRVINKILLAYSSQMKNIDLTRTRLGKTSDGQNVFTLSLEKVDLWGVNFKGANLDEANFKNSRFRGAGADGYWDTFDDAIADLSQAQLKQANLSEANLSRVLLNKSDLSRATLNKANLASARLIGTNLSSAQMVGADLRNAVLENASLTGADLGEAKLNEAELYGARLNRAIAIGAQLSYANLTKTDWQAADLSGAYLDHVNLSEANLSTARLTGAILRSANLEGANLRNTDLTLADLQGANVANVDFQGAMFFPAEQDQANKFVQTPELRPLSAVVKGVDFSQSKNLDRQQIAYICTKGGIHPRCI